MSSRLPSRPAQDQTAPLARSRAAPEDPGHAGGRHVCRYCTLKASSTSSVTGSGNDLRFEVRLTRVAGLLQLQALYAQPGSLGLSVLRVAPTMPLRRPIQDPPV